MVNERLGERMERIEISSTKIKYFYLVYSVNI